MGTKSLEMTFSLSENCSNFLAFFAVGRRETCARYVLGEMRPLKHTHTHLTTKQHATARAGKLVGEKITARTQMKPGGSMVLDTFDTVSKGM